MNFVAKIYVKDIYQCSYSFYFVNEDVKVVFETFFCKICNVIFISMDIALLVINSVDENICFITDKYTCLCANCINRCVDY